MLALWKTGRAVAIVGSGRDWAPLFGWHLAGIGVYGAEIWFGRRSGHRRRAQITVLADRMAGDRQMPANGPWGSVLPYCPGKWQLVELLTCVGLRGMAGQRCREGIDSRVGKSITGTMPVRIAG